MINRLPTVWAEPLLLGTGLSKVFDEFFGDFHKVGIDVAPTFGRSDIYEKDSNLVIETELPGAKKEDVSIKVEDDTVSISGEMKRSEEVKKENYFRMGRRYGSFQRTFPLPTDIADKKGIKAHFEDGILKVMVPLKESIKEKEQPIEIKVE
jgi:HSP20 family protein